MKELGKVLAYVLRHRPDAAGITLDAHGWADVDALIGGICAMGRKMDRATLEEIVATDEKFRFSFNQDGSKIRANQGHSVQVDVQPEERVPLDILYHGTAQKSVADILRDGIQKRTRLFVHLSADEATAGKVGARHGQPVVLQIDAKRMYADGYKFYFSANGVWLTEYVPSAYIAPVRA